MSSYKWMQFCFLLMFPMGLYKGTFILVSSFSINLETLFGRMFQLLFYIYS